MRAYALSGAAALAYQIVWYHALVDALGASGTTFLVVLCSFIGGLGLGSFLSPRVYRFLERQTGRRGLVHYGRTELVLTLAALLLMALVSTPLRGVLGELPYVAGMAGGVPVSVPSLGYEALRLGFAILAVGIPTTLMGLTFPYLVGLFPGEPRFASRLYAANTLGASAGVLFTEFVGVTLFGYAGCLALAASVTLGLGLFFSRVADAPPENSAGDQFFRAPVPFPAVLSGLLCGGLQALAYAFVRLVLGPTRGTFALLSFFAILGIWVASRGVHSLAPRPRRLALATLLGGIWCIAVYFVEPRVTRALLVWGASAESLSPRLAAFCVVAVAVAFLVLVPYTLFSTLLPDACDRLVEAGHGISKAYAANTIAFLCGVLAFGWLLPLVNVFFAARVFGIVALAGTCVLFGLGRRASAAVAFAALAIAVFLIPRGLPPRLLLGLEGGRRVLAYRSSPQHLFWVRENLGSQSGRSLMFDAHSMSGTSLGAQTYMRSMAHVPLLLNAHEPRRALLICFGVGSTADAIRQHRSIERLDIVDLNRSVYALNRHFAAQNGNVLADDRLRLFVDDGRQFVKLSEDRFYDLVTMEPPPPLQPGISRLYSMEYYAAVRSRLAEGGLVSQWLPEYLLDEDAVNLVVATFTRSFRHSLLMVGWGRDLILVGSDRPIAYAALQGRLVREDAVRRDLARLGFASAGDLAATFMRAGPRFREAFETMPVIEDGFASLDAIQVNASVQTSHPRSTFLAGKPSLLFHPEEVTPELERASPELASALRTALSDTATAARLSRIIPAPYRPPFRPAPVAPEAP